MAGAYAVFNPRPRRRRRRKNRTRRAHAKPHRRRRRRHNPFMAANAPRRRRGRHVARGRARRRHNPGLGVGGFKLPGGLDLESAFIGAIGAIGTDYLTGVIADQPFIPAAMKTGQGRLLTKTAVVIGVPMAIRAVGGPRAAGIAKWVAIGGGIGLFIDVYKQFLQPMLPGTVTAAQPQTEGYDTISGYEPSEPFQLGQGGDQYGGDDAPPTEMVDMGADSDSYF